MPNWYNGTVTIRGDISPFQKWYEEKKDSEDGFENSFAQTFAPLSSGKWDYGTACKEWGTKWDLGNISIISTEDGEFSFSFDSAWSPPLYLWKQLETRYGVEVEEFGYEEQQLEFYKYHKGRSICVERDDDWFKDNYEFVPSEEAKNDGDVFEEEMRDHKYEHWFDALNDWQDSVPEDHEEWKEVSDSDLQYDILMEAIGR